MNRFFIIIFVLLALQIQAQENSKIPEQRIPILLRTFESEDEAIKFLKEKKSKEKFKSR